MEYRQLSTMIPKFAALRSEDVVQIYYPDRWTPSVLFPEQCFSMTRSIDLSGKVFNENKTFFPKRIYQQESGVYQAIRNSGLVGVDADAIIAVTDVIHNAPLELDPFMYNPYGGEGPSFFSTDTSFQQILWGNWKMYGSSTNYSKEMQVMLKIQEGSFGSYEPTINEDLLFTRIIFFAALTENNDSVTVPAVRFILDGGFESEGKLGSTWRRFNSYAPSVQDGTH